MSMPGQEEEFARCQGEAAGGGRRHPQPTSAMVMPPRSLSSMPGSALRESARWCRVHTPRDLPHQGRMITAKPNAELLYGAAPASHAQP